MGTEVDNSLYQLCSNNSGMVGNDWNAETKGSQKLFLYMVQVMLAINIEWCFEILVSYLACSQIWLNLPVDHCHFGYIAQNCQKN